MKELIEKTFEEKRESFINRGIDIFKDFTFLVLTKFKNDILKKIQEQEEKAFNPVELGFKEHFITHDTILLKKGDFYCWYFEKGDNQYRIWKPLKKEDDNSFKIEFLEKSIDNSFKCFYLAYNIKIPNHRFGKELLKNLGVIK